MALENVKLILGLPDTDSSQDDLLTLLHDNAGKVILLYLQTDQLLDVPLELEFIQEELAVSRYNKLSHEGISQESQSSRSITFTMDDLRRYAGLLDNWSRLNSSMSQGNRLVML